MTSRIARFRAARPATFMIAAASVCVVTLLIVTFALVLLSTEATSSHTAWIRNVGDVISMVSFFLSIAAFITLVAYPFFVGYVLLLARKDRRDRPYNRDHAKTQDESSRP